MYVQRVLESRDLDTICTFPQSEEELFYVSPRFVFPLTPEQILSLVEDRFEPTVIIDDATQEVVAYANVYKGEEDMKLNSIGANKFITIHMTYPC
ncbi:hypothetical protein [Cohnella hashimotonis]|uniref:GNAT family N-acetyltransferase n=1 Tax=Cohnella hashimotonis TaxID=2826895 RepID=A0ABT6TJA9_9BACL|nr:hypothetical protein [Cohnella hashimotonis]MDI4646922.1 hypothetical protein [Cohnella hashimotonis]